MATKQHAAMLLTGMALACVIAALTVGHYIVSPRDLGALPSISACMALIVPSTILIAALIATILAGIAH